MPSSPPAQRHLRMITRLSAEEVLQRLARSIEKQAPWGAFQPRPRSWYFAGTIDGDHFSICRIPAGKRIYDNQIDGVVESTPDGASITLTVRPHSSRELTSMIAGIVMSGFALLFVLAPLYFAVIGQLPWNCGLFPIIVAALVVFFLRALPTSTATFDLDALTALDQLRSIFAAETEVPLDEATVPPRA